MAYVSKFKSKINDELFRAILALENNEECYKFFEDLMTIKELQSISQRWAVARMLRELQNLPRNRNGNKSERSNDKPNQ